ncbi:MAG: hypothetical protein ACI95C_000819 [Pseudohongiellaceae bacterium]|jgi:hypothetical protein
MSTKTSIALKSIALTLGAVAISSCSIPGITLFATNDSGATLTTGESANTHFFTHEMNHDSGIALEAGGRYAMDITILSNWTDSNIATNESDQPLDETGFANSLMPWDWVGLTRRSKQHNWFELMLKQPGCGGALGVSDLEFDETAGHYNFTADCSGRLQLFVNDSIGFYGNNVGYANITVSRLN